ncbi:MAG: hypothetical protein H7841_11210 [Magnetospirillum sp. WYHS-4]
MTGWFSGLLNTMMARSSHGSIPASGPWRKPGKTVKTTAIPSPATRTARTSRPSHRGGGVRFKATHPAATTQDRAA